MQFKSHLPNAWCHDIIGLDNISVYHHSCSILGVLDRWTIYKCTTMTKSVLDLSHFSYWFTMEGTFTTVLGMIGPLNYTCKIIQSLSEICNLTMLYLYFWIVLQIFSWKESTLSIFMGIFFPKMHSLKTPSIKHWSDQEWKDNLHHNTIQCCL